MKKTMVYPGQQELLDFCLSTTGWENNGSFDKVADIWEKINLKPKPYLTVRDQAFIDTYSEAIKDYTSLVLRFSQNAPKNS